MKKQFSRLLFSTTLIIFPFIHSYAEEIKPIPQDTAWVKVTADKIEKEVIDWRHHLHQNPELGTFEYKTADYISHILTSLNIDVTTGVAKTGVVGILKGGKPGPVVALRADIDALPVKEETGLPFSSKAKGVYLGTEVDVMHACGHDAHTAMLLGAAKVLAENRDQVPGTVVFIFQPAEEGAADSTPFDSDVHSHGAKRIIEEGILTNNNVQAIFGMHVMAGMPSGEIFYKSNAILNSGDAFRVTVHGRQTHGSMPWSGVDPIVTSAQIINAMQTLVSRKADLSKGMGVVSIGNIHSGSASNIIPEQVTFEGTTRSNHPVIRDVLNDSLPNLVQKIAEANGATATVQVAKVMPVTMNDPALTKAMVPYLTKAAEGKITELETNASASEDFSYYAEKVPGLFFFLGATPNNMDMKTAANNHSPKFIVDDATLVTGVKAHVWMVLGYANVATTTN